MFTMINISACFVFALPGIFCYTGPTCISSCEGKPTDFYQSCEGCTHFYQCASGTKITNPCGPYVWDDVLRTCTLSSTTCIEGAIPPGMSDEKFTTMKFTTENMQTSTLSTLLSTFQTSFIPPKQTSDQQTSEETTNEVTTWSLGVKTIDQTTNKATTLHLEETSPKTTNEPSTSSVWKTGVSTMFTSPSNYDETSAESSSIFFDESSTVMKTTSDFDKSTTEITSYFEKISESTMDDRTFIGSTNEVNNNEKMTSPNTHTASSDIIDSTTGKDDLEISTPKENFNKNNFSVGTYATMKIIVTNNLHSTTSHYSGPFSALIVNGKNSTFNTEHALGYYVPKKIIIINLDVNYRSTNSSDVRLDHRIPLILRVFEMPPKNIEFYKTPQEAPFSANIGYTFTAFIICESIFILCVDLMYFLKHRETKHRRKNQKSKRSKVPRTL